MYTPGAATVPALPTTGVLDFFTVSKNKSKITLTTVVKGATQLEGVPTWITVEPATTTADLNTETRDYTLTLEPGKKRIPDQLPRQWGGNVLCAEPIGSHQARGCDSKRGGERSDGANNK